MFFGIDKRKDKRVKMWNINEKNVKLPNKLFVCIVKKIHFLFEVYFKLLKLFGSISAKSENYHCKYPTKFFVYRITEKFIVSAFKTGFSDLAMVSLLFWYSSKIT